MTVIPQPSNEPLALATVSSSSQSSLPAGSAPNTTSHTIDTNTDTSTDADPSINLYEVSVVMPCLNEVRTLAGCIRQAREALDAGNLHGEIIVADNGSTDGSVELAQAEGAKVVHVARRGYGSALQGGFAAARGEYIFMADADGSYDFGEIPRFVARLREGYDLVMGNRFAGEIKPGAMPWHHRYIGNPVLSGIGRALFRPDCRDFHCGLRAFDRIAIEPLNLNSSGMEFATELVAKAAISEKRLFELPIELKPDGRDRHSHLRSIPDGFRHLTWMVLFKLRSIR